MKLTTTAANLTLVALVWSAGAAYAASAASSNEALVRASDGSVDLKKSDVCVSKEGRVFARKNGGACHKGDLAYVNVAFDSDKAGDLAEKFCDFKKDQPPESMNVYGVLCYLRITPSFRAKADATGN